MVAADRHRRHRDDIDAVLHRVRARAAAVSLRQFHRIDIFRHKAFGRKHFAERAVRHARHFLAVAVPCVRAGAAVARAGCSRQRHLAALAQSVLARFDAHRYDLRVAYNLHRVVASGLAA